MMIDSTKEVCVQWHGKEELTSEASFQDEMEFMNPTTPCNL